MMRKFFNHGLHGWPALTLGLVGDLSYCIRCLIFSLMAILSFSVNASTWYVAKTGSDLNAGTSKSSPFLTIQQAVNVASANDTIIVSNGVYDTFSFVPGIGGSWAENLKKLFVKSVGGPEETTIKGSQLRLGDPYTFTAATAMTVEGFTITGSSEISGGVLSRCKITGNSGVSFICCCEVHNSLVFNNTVENSGAGEFYATLVYNSTIYENHGAYVACDSRGTTFYNCIIFGKNKGLYTCANWGNYSYNGCSSDPGCVDVANNDFHLLPTSICIDAGNNSYANVTDTDLAGNQRIYNETVDIGAYEYQPSPMGIENIIARQRYPWNGLVDLSFTVTGEPTEEYDVSFVAKDVVGNTNLAMVTLLDAKGAALSSTNSVLPGNYNWIWNATADLPDGFKCDRVSVVGSVGAQEPGLYMVVDLSGGSTAAKYPVSYLDAVPAGGWTDEYKTTKVVLRKIFPTSYNSSNGQQVTLTKSYFVGIFEFTQEQYELIVGSNPSTYKGKTRPVESVSYDMIRGSEEGAKWPSSAEVDASSLIGLLRSKTELRFDLPTRAQWECACLGGQTASQAFSLSKGRVGANKSDGRGGYSGNHTSVGAYSANAWGIFDMIGNVHEWVLDCDRDFTMGGTDPVGPSCYWSDGSLCRMRVRMGEAWHSEDSYPSYTLSALAKSWDWSYATNPYNNYSGTHGFRVCLEERE